MSIYIYLLCNNESAILRATVEHYRRRFPNSIITILDNESTDASPYIAREMGCIVMPIYTQQIMNEFVQTQLKNTIWNQCPANSWIIMADMDEWLNISMEDIVYEVTQGTTILSVKGFNMVGQSKKTDLSDIDIHLICRGYEYEREDKNICFSFDAIREMNYSYGAHLCAPVAHNGYMVRFSQKIYSLKHMAYLGREYYIARLKHRRIRAETFAREYGLNLHYCISEDEAGNDFQKSADNATFLRIH